MYQTSKESVRFSPSSSTTTANLLRVIEISLKPLSPLHPSTPPFRLFWTEDTTYPSPSVPPVVLPPLKEKDKDKNGEREKERDKVREVETARSRDGDKEGDGRLVVLGFGEFRGLFR